MNGRTDRIWMIGGAAGAVLLVAIGWFLLINPTNVEADGLRERTQVIELERMSLDNRLRELKAEKARLPEYQAQLGRNKQALPADSGVPAFLRQLEQAGNTVGASVSNVSVGVPTAIKGDSPTVFSLPITVTADGTPGQLSPFLDQLQQVQPRAILIETANLTAAATDQDKGGDKMNLTLTLKVFVAPAAGAAKPAATPTS
jgi:Tfp pilus assembly protein PilO